MRPRHGASTAGVRSAFLPVCRSFPGAKIRLRVVVCVWRGCVRRGCVRRGCVRRGCVFPAWLYVLGVAGVHGPAPHGRQFGLNVLGTDRHSKVYIHKC